MTAPRKLGVADIGKITDAIEQRQRRWGEPLHMSVGVVLLNYGEGSIEVRCTQGEWSGTKADLSGGRGLPLCPNGHPLFEGSGRQVLALVDEAGS